MTSVAAARPVAESVPDDYGQHYVRRALKNFLGQRNFGPCPPVPDEKFIRDATGEPAELPEGFEPGEEGFSYNPACGASDHWIESVHRVIQDVAAVFRDQPAPPAELVDWLAQHGIAPSEIEERWANAQEYRVMLERATQAQDVRRRLQWYASDEDTEQFIDEQWVAASVEASAIREAITGPKAQAELRAPLRPMPLAEIFDQPTPTYLVKHLIPNYGVGLLYGASGVYKTFAVIHLGMCVARGEPFFEKRVNKGRVVYVAAEAGAGIPNRVRAYIRHHNLEESLAGIEFLVVPRGIDLRDAKAVRALIKAIQMMGGADLVIIDTLAASMPGGDENSSTDMGGALNHASHMGRELAAFVLLIHHVGKDASRGPRGWSGAHGNVDVMMLVDRSDVDSAVSVITNQKIREGSVIDNTLAFRPVVVPLYTDEDGDMVTSCAIEPCPVPVKTGPSSGLPESRPRRRGRVQAEILTAAADLTVSEVPVATNKVIDAAFERISAQAAAGNSPAPRRRDVERVFWGMVQAAELQVSPDQVLVLPI